MPDAEAHAQDLLLARRQCREHLARLLAQVALDCSLDRRGRELVLDKISQRTFFFVADWRFERNRFLDDLEHLLDLVQRHLHLLGDFLGAGFAAEPLHQQARHAQQLVDGLDHVHRDANGAALVGDRARHRLPNPPRRVRRKFVAALIFELVHRAHQADVAFLDKVEKAEPAIGVALGEADDEAQVGLGQFLFRATALVLSGGDRLELARVILAVVLRFLFDFANRLLRQANPRRDIEQVFADVIYLENVAAVFGLGGFFKQISARASGRLFVFRDGVMRDAVLLQEVAHLADHRFHQAARQRHRAQFFLHALVVALQVLVEFGFAARAGLVAEFFLDGLDFGAQVGQLLGRQAEFLELPFVGLGTALFVGIIGRLGGVFEHVAEVGFARLDSLAHSNHEIEHDRRAQHFFFDFILAGLDALGDLDFLLARQQLEVAHLLEIEPNRVRRLAERIRRRRGGLGRFFGLFLGLDLDLVGAFGRDFLEDLDIKILEAVERGAQVGGRCDILRQVVVDLLEGQVTLLAAEIDQPL